MVSWRVSWYAAHIYSSFQESLYSPAAPLELHFTIAGFSITCAPSQLQLVSYVVASWRCPIDSCTFRRDVNLTHFGPDIVSQRKSSIKFSVDYVLKQLAEEGFSLLSVV